MSDIKTSFDCALHAAEKCLHDITIEPKEEFVSDMTTTTWDLWFRRALRTCSTFFFKAAIKYHSVNRPNIVSFKFDDAFNAYRQWYNHIDTVLSNYNLVMINELFYDAHGNGNHNDFVVLLRDLRNTLKGLVKAFTSNGIPCSDLKIFNQLLLSTFQSYVEGIFRSGDDGIAWAPSQFNRIYDGCENAIYRANPVLFDRLFPHQPYNSL